MSACCSAEKPKIINDQCPVCDEACKSVTMATVLQHVSYPLNTQLQEDMYFFCPNTDCETGYFTDAGFSVAKQQLAESDHIQHGWLCYCFGISRPQYIKELKAGMTQNAKAFVIDQTRVGNCSCETRNPSGQCCLADFKRVEKCLVEILS